MERPSIDTTDLLSVTAALMSFLLLWFSGVPLLERGMGERRLGTWAASDVRARLFPRLPRQTS
jgi:steroid 5-alpha reductase family enzyme